MQSSLLIAAIGLIALVCECRGYSHQPQPYNTQHYPHPAYGVPPPPPPLSRSSLSYDTPTYLPPPTINAVVRTLEPIGKNYEVKLSQASGHQQFGYGGQTYLPPPLPQVTPPQPFHQYQSSVPLSIPYTTQQNLPHQSQSAPPAQRLLNSNNQQYLPSVVANHFSRQRNQIGQHANAFNTQFGQANSSANGVVGNYISQSEASELSHYFEKQNPVGDTRPFNRVISTCYPDGHCDQQKLGSAQVHPKHQRLVQSARASMQPVTNKCQTSKSAVHPNSISDHGAKEVSAALKKTKFFKLDPIRPPNRRLYPYGETVIARDPFN